jgi:hypothetical protein
MVETINIKIKYKQKETLKSNFTCKVWYFFTIIST